MNSSYIIIQLASALAIFIIGFPYLSFPQIILQGTMMQAFQYFSHRFVHILPKNSFIFHTFLHHGKYFQSRLLELFIETVGEMISYIAIPIGLQYLFGVELIHPLIIIFTSLVYISVHIINYSIFGSDTHSRHHKDPSVNFGPDFYDHIFGTNYDSTYENMHPMYINIIIITILLCGARHQAQLDFF